MYRDVAQWLSIRDQVIRKGVSMRQIVRETGISRKTVRKMLNHPYPASLAAPDPYVQLSCIRLPPRMFDGWPRDRPYALRRL